MFHFENSRTLYRKASYIALLIVKYKQYDTIQKKSDTYLFATPRSSPAQVKQTNVSVASLDSLLLAVM